MSAAILHGVPATTLDTDIWIDAPERQYMRLINLSLNLGAIMVRQTIVALTDGSLVNFCYRLHGTASFRTEYARASRKKWNGIEIRLLPLERIIRSKTAADRDKDRAVLPLLRDIAASKKHLRIRR